MHGRRPITTNAGQDVAFATATAPVLSDRHPTPPAITPMGSDRRPRIAYLSFSSGEYDARTQRMARSSVAAGCDVTVYARWQPGFPRVEHRDGYRIIRAPFDWRLAVPGLRDGARRRIAAEMAQGAVIAPTSGPDDDDRFDTDATVAPPASTIARLRAAPRILARRGRRRLTRPIRRWWRLAQLFPLRPMGWAVALDEVVEPADVWHGMWAGSLPALARVRRRFGGRTIYDSRDVYMQTRNFSQVGSIAKAIPTRLERRWAQGSDRVLTVNDPYADLLVDQLGIDRPTVVMNTSAALDPLEPRPDLIRAALGLPASTAIALYQGNLIQDRGIEESMDAILDVPDAVLVLLGFGPWRARLTELTAQPPYAGRVQLLPAVPPDELLGWTASADVSVMAIQPTTINHAFTTPQKLFESIAAGVPVVAADLPGMAQVVRSAEVGVVCDPTSPAAIAAAIRTVLEVSPEERADRRDRILRVARERFDWQLELVTLFSLYDELLPVGVARVSSVREG